MTRYVENLTILEIIFKSLLQIQLLEYQIDWLRDGDVDDPSAPILRRQKREPWYTGPDPFTHMEVRVIEGIHKLRVGTVQSSRVTEEGEYLVTVAWYSPVGGYPAELRLSQVREYL